MALTNDWQITIDAWLSALQERITRPLAELNVQHFTTMEHLSPEQAASNDFSRWRRLPRSRSIAGHAPADYATPPVESPWAVAQPRQAVVSMGE